MAKDGYKIFDSDTHVGPYMEVLEKYLADNTNAWEMQADGSYVRRTITGKHFTAQEYLLNHPSTKLLFPADVE